MNKWTMRMGVVILVVVIAFGAIGVAAAQGPDSAGPRPGGQRGPDKRLAGALMQTVQEMTGLSAREVLQELRDGKTLATVLEENGVDPQTVIDRVLADATARVEQAVADGKISQENADAILARVGEALNKAVYENLPLPPNQNPKLRERLQQAVEMSLVGALAEMAGTDARSLLRDALTPPTLADIAESNGVSSEAVVAEAEARITEQVNQMVADGKISQEQADAILDGLYDRLVNRMNAPLVRPGGQRNRPPGRFDGFRNRPGRPAGGGQGPEA